MDLGQVVLAHELAIRVGCFLGVFVLVALWEGMAPRRALILPRALRWASNLGLVLLNSLLLRLMFPMAAVGVAAFAAAHGWGLLNHFDIAWEVALPLSVIALDLVIWLQHVMVHAVPALWRLHRVHHADPDFDLTTGARFHPLEIVLSMLIKFAAIVVLGDNPDVSEDSRFFGPVPVSSIIGTVVDAPGPPAALLEKRTQSAQGSSP